MADLKAKKEVLSEAEYMKRVQALCRSQAVQRVAAACAKNLTKVCKEVVSKKGGMARS